MKFKKVEIDAFRAYRDKKDGTFDFSYRKDSSEERIANLIAIYGPNGFGKTSFSDAIEWGMTKRIKRLERCNEYAKDERGYQLDQTGENNKQYILKNRDEKSKEQGEVIITFDNGEPKVNKTKILRAGQSDYFPLAKLQNAFFRDIILSQAGIDAFLMEEEPEERYNRFVEHFDNCKDADRIFKNITQLITENIDNFNKTNKKIVDINREIKLKAVPDGTIGKVNDIINDLKKQGEGILDLNKLSLLDNTYNSKDLDNLFTTVITYINIIVSGETGLLNNFRKTEMDLDNLLLELPNYLLGQEEKKKTEVEMKKLEEIIFLFDELENVRNKQNYYENIELNLKKEMDYLRQFDTLRPVYNEISNKIDSLKKGLENHNTHKQQINVQIAGITGKIKKLEIELKAIEMELEDSIEKNNGIDLRFSNYNKSIENKVALINELKGKSNERISLEEKQKQSNLELAKLQKLKQEMNGEIDSKSGYLDLLFPGAFEMLKKQRIIWKRSEETLEEINRKVENMNSLKELYDKIISFGKRYILDTKSRKCPLCGAKEYSDFNELVSQIDAASNLSLESIDFADLIKNQETEISENRKQYESAVKDVGIKIDSKIKDINDGTITLARLISENMANEKRLIQNLELIENQINQHKKSFGDKKIAEIKADLGKKINELENKKQVKTNELLEEKKQESILQIEKIEIQKNIDIKNGEIDELKNRNNFVDYIDLISGNSSLQNIESGITDSPKEKLRLNREINNNQENLVNNKKSIDSLAERLQKESENDIEKRLNSAEKCIAERKRSIGLFLSRINKYFPEELLPDTEMKEELESKKKEFGSKIEILKNLNNQFNTLKDQYEILEKHLNLNDLNKSLEDLNIEKKKLSNLKQILEDNKKKIGEHIEALINSFFEKELINEIYKRIEPHPEYKEISFKADLSGKSPKLNIYAEKEVGNAVSPNIFFSTAQVNVLSLSIFLARALKAKDDKGNSIDTIFLDDPIQSMDSINILSVIDLIRTIIFQHDKQVIVTTHDENFFNLLKRKIPAEYYPAKFLEFETFGKVIESHEQ